MIATREKTTSYFRPFNLSSDFSTCDRPFQSAGDTSKALIQVHPGNAYFETWPGDSRITSISEQFGASPALGRKPSRKGWGSCLNGALEAERLPGRSSLKASPDGSAGLAPPEARSVWRKVRISRMSLIFPFYRNGSSASVSQSLSVYLVTT